MTFQKSMDGVYAFPRGLETLPKRGKVVCHRACKKDRQIVAEASRISAAIGDH